MHAISIFLVTNGPMSKSHVSVSYQPICVTAAKSLHVFEEAARYASDHNPLILHIACDTNEHAPTSNPSVASGVRVRYDVQRAEAYQEAPASLLQEHFILFIQHSLMLTCWPPNS